MFPILGAQVHPLVRGLRSHMPPNWKIFLKRELVSLLFKQRTNKWSRSWWWQCAKDVGSWRNVVEGMSRNMLADERTSPTPHFPIMWLPRKSPTHQHTQEVTTQLIWPLDESPCLKPQQSAYLCSHGHWGWIWPTGLNKAMEEETSTVWMLSNFQCVQMKLGCETLVSWGAHPKTMGEAGCRIPHPHTLLKVITWLMLLRATFEREEKHISPMAIVLLNFACLNTVTLFVLNPQRIKSNSHTQRKCRSWKCHSTLKIGTRGNIN